NANSGKVPSALKPIEDPLAFTKQVKTGAVDATRVRRAIDDGNAWFSNHHTMESEGHTFYYLYAYERYRSFRELAEQRIEANPAWYNEIVSYLKTNHQTDHWSDGDGDTVATSFAILALMRSTKKTLATVAGSGLGAGVLIGGRGLPPKT